MSALRSWAEPRETAVRRFSFIHGYFVLARDTAGSWRALTEFMSRVDAEAWAARWRDGHKMQTSIGTWV